MSKRNHKHKRALKPPGSPPGLLVSDPNAPRPVIRVMAFGPDRYLEEEIKDLERLRSLRGQWPVLWIDVDGLGDAGFIGRVGAEFNLHPLALEDAVNAHQRAKVELYEHHLFIVARMVCRNGRSETEQLSLFLGDGFLISFQEGRPGDVFDPVRERIRKNAGLLRRLGADYMAYSLLDAVIDGYFPLIEEIGERLEDLEDEILARPRAQAVARLHEIKRDLITLRRAAWPLREATNALVRDPNRFIGEDARVHLRDCYDHVVRIIDFVETDRELASDLMDLYLSSINQRMTEVMKVLTIIATVFIPLTFIAGLYGMNFNTRASRWNMPELEWAYGYPFALGVMAATAAGMVIYFWHKGWIGGSAPDKPPDDQPPT